MRPEGQTRFAVLDGWRGVCALLVAAYHFHPYSHIHDWTFLRHGYMVVDFFFVLSGFVLAHAYRSRLSTVEDSFEFILRRLGRLYPLHVFFILVWLLYELARVWASQFPGQVLGHPPFGPSMSLYALITNLLLVHSLGLHNSLTWNFPSWSISTEFYTNVLFALCCVVALSPRSSRMAKIGIVAVSPLVIAAISPAYIDTTYDFGIVRCIYGFVVGVLALDIVEALRRRPVAASLLSNRIAVSVLEVGALIALYEFVSAFGKESPYSTLAPMLFGVVVWVFSYETGLISRVLKSRPFALAGTLSYSIYLSHAIVQVAFSMVAHYGFGLSYVTVGDVTFIGSNIIVGDLLYCLMLAAVFGVSFVTYRYIEEPCRVRMNKVARRLRLRGTLQLQWKRAVKSDPIMRDRARKLTTTASEKVRPGAGVVASCVRHEGKIIEP